MKTGLFIPTLNAGKEWEKLLRSIEEQSHTCHRRVIVDSGSSDQTVALAHRYGWEVVEISPTAFDHGGTRNMALTLLSDCDVVVYLTQDVMFDLPDALSRLVEPFEINPEVACSYGRQLPHDDASAVARHARIFNYPVRSQIKDHHMIETYGFKTCFVSNSFAAWRMSDLRQNGGFPSDIVFGEDACMAAKLILKEKQIVYVADAQVHHSHNYNFLEVMKRYFDIGVFHATQPWIRDQFGTVSGEGVRFIVSEVRYLLMHAPHYLLKAALDNLSKMLGYRLGRVYHRLPFALRARLSLNPNYWERLKQKSCKCDAPS
ncbi:rhamnosyltransferase [Breznakibacter xylanolyticus]|uniref:Rhamnosyltransferase n=1 Tax=Breznakibacter xylanolyticus TaxID=990 RepID=A0A2W7NII0_9BACT|nr:glycosyltransferase family 2 protein [Breznakibacter xylanolyticus]PZX12976.1 rhamnosyltransferase [Breznakibacter xylanolyticus]